VTDKGNFLLKSDSFSFLVSSKIMKQSFKEFQGELAKILLTVAFFLLFRDELKKARKY
jgi:hypothetical protein